jgi:hypothetical protein
MAWGGYKYSWQGFVLVDRTFDFDKLAEVNIEEIREVLDG